MGHFHAQRGLCLYCGCEMEVGGGSLERATLDHIVARARGGPDTRENTCAACSRCNTEKGDMPVEDWIAELKTKARVVILSTASPNAAPAWQLLAERWSRMAQVRRQASENLARRGYRRLVPAA